MILVMRPGAQHSQAQLWERLKNNNFVDAQKVSLGDSFIYQEICGPNIHLFKTS